MSRLFLIVFLISSFGAFTCLASDTGRIAKVLINSPKLVTILNLYNVDHLRVFKVEEVKEDLNRITMSYSRVCECEPANAEVVVLEDLTDTYPDGAPIYDVSINVISGFNEQKSSYAFREQ